MSRTPPPLADFDAFRRACGRFATGIAIATIADASGAPQGMTVNSFTSVSADPALVLICVDFGCNLLPAFQTASHYGINVLSERQQDLSDRFACRGHDRFDGVDWYAGETGVPLLRGSLAHLECGVKQVVDAGDHSILLGQVHYAHVFSGRPLLYFESAYRRLD
ncbi:MAG: flavin reductase family protein [Bryobacteraceae bacterium]